jgi:hypothetical protein
MHWRADRHIGFVTDAERRLLTDDDRGVIPALASRGIRVVPVVWTEPLPGGLDALVVRSTWDYHLRLREFLAWIDGTEAERLPLLNRAPVLRWNADKRYLLDLERCGVPVVPTRHLPRGATTPLDGLLRGAGWSEAVVKPAVSAGAFATWRTRGAPEDRARFARQLADMDCLVQPFLPERVDEGEWSLVFLGGAFSHAVLKRPGAGDFRVQEEFGGCTEAVVPPAGLVEDARRALDAAGHDTAYARVDGVVRRGRLDLLELELVEPSLFLASASGAAERFAEAISARLE